MKSPRKFLAAFLAACFFTVAAFAADASPAGTWKWMQAGRNGGQGSERKAQIEMKDGKLTGKMLAYESPRGPQPEAELSDVTFKDGVVSFSLKRDFGGNSFVIKYSGKLEGDTIKGSQEFPGFNGGEATKSDWEAKREK
jgi:hypothetical protein